MSKLLNLIESLQSGLTNTDRPSQRDAFSNLNEGIKLLPTSAFSEKEVTHVVDFYVAHLALADPGLVGVLLEGLNWLAQSSHLSPNDATNICLQGFFSKLHIPTLGKGERQKALHLFTSLITKEKTRQGLLLIKLEFVRGFIASVEGEKDPVCLMDIFDMHCIMMQHFHLGHLEEDYFDCVAAYFPVDYTPPPGNPSGVTRPELAEKLHTALFASRHFAGSLLLPLLLEKAASHWPEGRSDALELLADCLNGWPHSQTHFADFRLKLDVEAEKPISMANISAYLYAICNLIRELTLELDPMDRNADFNRLLTIVHGLTVVYTNQKLEHTISDFVETFLASVWPDRKEKFVLEHFFCVPPLTTLSAMPKPAPQGVLADCLLTAAVASTESCSVQNGDSSLCSRLFGRLAEALLSAKVVDPLPKDNVFYEAKFDQLITWTPHVGFLNRLLATLERLSPATLKGLLATRGKMEIMVVNLSQFLQIACCKLSLCAPRCDTAMMGDDAQTKSDTLQRRLTEAALFSLLARVILPPHAEISINSGTAEALLNLCQHILDHLAHDVDDDSLNPIRFEQKLVFSKLLTASSPVGERLLTFLFNLLQENPDCVATDILKRAACENEAILNRLLTSLFVKGLSNDRVISTVLLSISQTLRQESERLARVAHFLLKNIETVWCIIGRLRIEEDILMLNDFLNAFRLITAGLIDEDQEKFLESFSLICGATKVLKSNQAIMLESAVISALRSNVVKMHCEKLFAGLMHSIQVASESEMPLVLIIELIDCLSSLLNKSLVSVATGTFTDVLNILTPRHTQLASRLVVQGLRALLSCPLNPTQDSLQPLIDRLLAIIVPDSKGKLDALELSRACLTDSIQLLMPTDDSDGIGSCISRNLHCNVSPLAVQKCYCYVALRSRKAWTDASDLKDAYLFAYLKLTSMLPETLITGYISDALEASVMAVTSGRYPLATQALGLSLISRIASQLPSGLSASEEVISSADADDLLEKLPLLLDISSGIDKIYTHTANLRFHLAHSLCYLVEMPTPVTSRHKSRVSRLLESLLDDDCRSVRLEAARALNKWSLKV